MSAGEGGLNLFLTRHAPHLRANRSPHLFVSAVLLAILELLMAALTPVSPSTIHDAGNTFLLVFFINAGVVVLFIVNESHFNVTDRFGYRSPVFECFDLALLVLALTLLFALPFCAAKVMAERTAEVRTDAQLIAEIDHLQRGFGYWLVWRSAASAGGESEQAQAFLPSVPGVATLAEAKRQARQKVAENRVSDITLDAQRLLATLGSYDSDGCSRSRSFPTVDEFVRDLIAYERASEFITTSLSEALGPKKALAYACLTRTAALDAVAAVAKARGYARHSSFPFAGGVGAIVMVVASTLAAVIFVLGSRASSALPRLLARLYGVLVAVAVSSALTVWIPFGLPVLIGGAAGVFAAYLLFVRKPTAPGALWDLVALLPALILVLITAIFLVRQGTLTPGLWSPLEPFTALTHTAADLSTATTLILAVAAVTNIALLIPMRNLLLRKRSVPE